MPLPVVYIYYQRIAESLKMSKKKVRNATEVLKHRMNRYFIIDPLLFCYFYSWVYLAFKGLDYECRQSVRYSRLTGRHFPL